jgi:hypothetical protein
MIVFWPYATAIAAALLLFLILNTTNETQQYQFQALQTIEQVKRVTNDSLNNDLNFKLQEIPAATTQPIANNSKNSKAIKKGPEKQNYNTPIVKDVVIPPKKTVQPNLKKTKPFIKKQELEQLNNNGILTQNKAIAENKTQPKESIPTLKQSIHNSIKTRIFKEEETNNKLIDKQYLIAATSEKLNNSKNISFEQSEKKARKKTRLKIGKFEFYRDKKV